MELNFCLRMGRQWEFWNVQLFLRKAGICSFSRG
nr:MAG TPA: Nucleotidyltransferase [Caudoviricetes sp.]